MNNDILVLEQQLQLETDPKKRIDMMNNLSWEIRRLNSERSISLCREANKLASDIDYEMGYAESYLCLSIHDSYADNHDEALKKCRKAFKIFEANNHIDGQIKAYNSSGVSYMKLGKYDQALESLLKGLSLARENGNLSMAVFFLNNIGEIYKDTINMYDEALKYYIEASEHCESTNNSIHGIILSSIGECYQRLGDSEKAVEYTHKGLVKAKGSEDKIAMAYCYHVLGRTYKNMDDIDSALENLLLSMKYRKEANHKYGLAEVLSELGSLYMSIGIYNKALESLTAALTLADEINAEFITGNMHKLLAEVYEKVGQFEDSILHYKKYMELNTKTISKELETRISALTADSKVQQAKKDAEIYKLKNVELKAKSEEIEKKAKELEESYNNIAVISEIGQKITSSLDIETIMNTIYLSMNSLMDATVFGVGLYDDINEIIEYKIFIENSQRLPLFKTSIDDPKSFAAKCIRSRKEVCISNLMDDGTAFLIPDGGPDAVSLIPHSLIYFPLFIENKVIGTVTVQSYKENAYTQHNLNTLKALASYIAIAVTNSQKNEELQKTADELVSTLAHLQDTQEYLIQSEKMAALGQLISGIAHEINTPLGAIQASINNISEYMHHTIGEKLPDLFKILDVSSQQLFFYMLHASMQKDVTISSKDERRLKKSLEEKLEAWKIDNSDSIADTLVDMGIYEAEEKYLPLFRHQEGTFIVQVCYELSGILRNISNMDIAVGKASKMLYALKNYAHFDHTEIPVESNITEGIETVLALYHNNMKHGTELIKNFTAVPDIKCFPDELNQVWTNLIHNSLQAMDYKGTLEINIRQEDAHVLVSISDSGTGIPVEIKDKIFEPFFTTKRQGEGSGLGLGIVKKIVNKHKGDILVESKPGRTTFTVRLPIN